MILWVSICNTKRHFSLHPKEQSKTMDTETFSKEELQQMINSVRDAIETVEDKLHDAVEVFETRKNDHKQKVEETTNDKLEEFKLSESTDLNDLFSAMHGLKRESKKLTAEEDKCVKDLQTMLRSSIMTELKMDQRPIKVEMMDKIVHHVNSQESFVLNKHTLKQLYDKTKSEVFPDEPTAKKNRTLIDS